MEAYVRRIIILLVLIFNLRTSSVSKMIPIIIKFDNGRKIRIAYYIDDKCEDCLDKMKPCDKHKFSKENNNLYKENKEE